MNPNIFQKIVAWMLIAFMGMAALYGILFFFGKIFKMVGLMP